MKSFAQDGDVRYNAGRPAANLPPMLQQYLEYKNRYPDCLLMFQVGDFYELFFDDAVTVSRTLNLTLTSRDKNNPNPVPMCGVPLSVVDAYIERLVSARYSVAVVSQRAEFSVSGKQSISRYLERIVTPGIKILGNIERDSNVQPIAALYMSSDNDLAVAFSNIQSGRVMVRENLQTLSLIRELQRIQPIEVVLPAVIADQKIDRRVSWVSEINRSLPGATIKTRNISLEADGVTRQSLSGLKGYSIISASAKKAVQLLLGYVDETTVNIQVPVSEVAQEVYEGVVAIDATTRRNLELVNNMRDGTSEATLFDFLNFTSSPGGERLLKQVILNPLCAREEIILRLNAVSLLVGAHSVRPEIAKNLSFMSDLERLAARIELKAILPKEVAALRNSLFSCKKIKDLCVSIVNEGQKNTQLLSEIISHIVVPEGLHNLVNGAIKDNPEPTLNLGGIIKEGYNEELDQLRSVKSKGAAWIVELENSEKERTGISSLKIKYNNVIGYFFEVTNANVSKVPQEYIRKQTTANGERFTTHELRSREKELFGAEAKIIELERKLFEEVRGQLLEFVVSIRLLASATAHLDLFVSLAQAAEVYDLKRPEINDNADLLIEEGKHPVLMKILREDYVPTSLSMSGKGQNFLIITGPNMGGKSTYLRQTALLVIMAQIGSFVPAKKAEIGLVDKIFARLGASDNQREGESTFMVEMREASYILAEAGERSLVLIDEIGRGTATADGLSIAQSMLEWIADRISCRTLFATHFHELTKLEEKVEAVVNYSVQSYESGGEVIFSHNIIRGAASSSYGLEVARLAGLPAELLKRAQELLNMQNSENQKLPKMHRTEARQIEIFDASRNKDVQEIEKLKELRVKLKAIDLNNITPIESLNTLSKIISEC